MQNKKNISCNEIGDVICSPQNQKYQILQKINTLKRASQQIFSTFYHHLDTFIVKKQSNREYYILKRYELNLPEKSGNNKEYVEQSSLKNKSFAKDLKSKILFHPNLLHIEDIFFQRKYNQQKAGKYFNLVEQYCEQGDLAYFINRQLRKSSKSSKNQSFHQKLIAKWLLQVLLALELLHFNKIAHQQIKLDNIYLTPLGNLKLNGLYLLNSISLVKQLKKAKQSNALIEGYQPMLNDKKFKLNQKKDVIDFALFLSYLCNPQLIKQNKKQGKSKNLAHLPPSYSQDLDKIYLDCLNAKKTGVLVKDILKTSYFLQIMRQFIIDKKLNVSVFQRIPIKKYTIHKKKTPSKSDKNKLNQQGEKEKFPKIQKNSKVSDSKFSQKKVQQNQYDSKKLMRASLQKLKNKLQLKQKQSRENQSRQKKLRKNSMEKQKEEQKKSQKQKQKPRILTPILSGKQTPKLALLPPPPSLQKNKKNNSKSQLDNNVSQNSCTKKSEINLRQKIKQQGITRSQSNSPKKCKQKQKQFNLTPQITFGKKRIENDEGNGFKLKPQTVQCTNSQQSSVSKQSELSKISQNLAKIFTDLKIRQDDDQELSFQMDAQDQQQLRLTFKNQKQDGDENDLMKTYKNKFDQIILELHNKYQPNLETIIQKTTEWDSNDFFVNQQLLKRLRLEQGESLISPSNFNQNQQNAIEQNFETQES